MVLPLFVVLCYPNRSHVLRQVFTFWSTREWQINRHPEKKIEKK